MKGFFMQNLRIDFNGYSSAETDRLIAVIFSYLKSESSEIHMEFSRTVPIPATLMGIPADKILYVTSDRHYCFFHLTDSIRKVRMNFRDVLRLLEGQPFLSCNRGVLLSMNHITEYRDGSFVMRDGARFSPRTKHRKEIIRQYESYRILHE